MRDDLPNNRFLARDIQILERLFGAENIEWPKSGAWVHIKRGFPVVSTAFRLSLSETPLLMFVPPGYGERRGQGAGIEEFYVDPKLKIARGTKGAFQEIPHTYLQVDRRGGAINQRQWRYACVHIDFDPRRHSVVESLTLLKMMFADPWTFERLGEFV